MKRGEGLRETSKKLVKQPELAFLTIAAEVAQPLALERRKHGFADITHISRHENHRSVT
jgi:hypothetical protein